MTQVSCTYGTKNGSFFFDQLSSSLHPQQMCIISFCFGPPHFDRLFFLCQYYVTALYPQLGLILPPMTDQLKSANRICGLGGGENRHIMENIFSDSKNELLKRKSKQHLTLMHLPQSYAEIVDMLQTLIFLYKKIFSSIRASQFFFLKRRSWNKPSLIQL